MARISPAAPPDLDSLDSAAPAFAGEPALDTSDDMKCALCKEPVVEGKMVRALDQKWHLEHFLCAQCFKPFPNMEFHECDGKAYCASDFADLFGPRCGAKDCKQLILGPVVTTLDRKYHPEHFRCDRCSTSLAGQEFREYMGEPLCLGCHRALAPATSVCPVCRKPIPEGMKTRKVDGKAVCDSHFVKAEDLICGKCGQQVKGKCVPAFGKVWHPEHFVCAHKKCGSQFKDGAYYEYEGKPYCVLHYRQKGMNCARCGEMIIGKGVAALGQNWHTHHFSCLSCGRGLAGKPFAEHDRRPICKKCFIALTPELRKQLVRTYMGPIPTVKAQ